MNLRSRSLLLSLGAAGVLFYAWPSSAGAPMGAPQGFATAPVPQKGQALATFGGGCFWCLEAAFEELKGVDAAVSGYAGGRVASPSYEAVCSGQTGHAEVVQIRFNPAVVSYRDLVRAFFVIHDPTTKDRQGNDHGTQYRSIILTHDEAQRTTAQAEMKAIAPSFGKPLTTQLVKFDRFYPAEVYHQDYFAKNPDQPYCAFVVAPKVEKLRHAFIDKLKK